MTEAQMSTQVLEDRIWVDGCFDFFHHGHANALRQAREHGNELIVGLHTDEDIEYNKGPVVMHLTERVLAVEACKWTTMTVPGAPYVTDPDVMDAHACKYVVHGDDITTDANGVDSYQHVKDLGRFITVKRTPEISTTDLISRMLGTAPPHSLGSVIIGGEHPVFEPKNCQRLKDFASAGDTKGAHASVLAYGSDTGKLKSMVCPFEEVRAALRAGATYIPGTFDLVHSGHFEMLGNAREQGNPVVVGLYNDDNDQVPPLMNLFERAMCLLQCRYVDAVILGAPRKIDRSFADLLLAEGIRVVSVSGAGSPIEGPWQFNKIPRGPNGKLSSKGIIGRVLSQQTLYIERQLRKGVKAAAEADLRAAEKALEAAKKAV